MENESKLPNDVRILITPCAVYLLYPSGLVERPLTPEELGEIYNRIKRLYGELDDD